jgi:TM2 domain-containing membrane protein YozV
MQNTQEARPRARSPFAAAFLSLIFPGLGQLYNREFLKGVLFIVPGAVLTWLFMRAVPTDILALAQPPASLIFPMLLLLAVWLWAIIDAWRVAGR